MNVCFGVIVRTRINQHCVCVSSGVLVRSAPFDPGVCVLSPLCRSASCAGFSDGAVPRWLCGQKPPQYDAFTGGYALLHIHHVAGMFGSLMEAKLYNTIGAPIVEHCASCDIVRLRLTSERKELALSSTTIFDVRNARYARVQECDVAVKGAVLGDGLSSEATIKAALFLKGMRKGPGGQFKGWFETHGAE